MTDAAFDTMAASYDADFTHSAIGKIQRQRVWKHMDEWLNAEHLEILELNCGTGEDALHFANHGNRVLATDISSEMISIATDKIVRNQKQELVHCQTASIQEIIEVANGKKFDMVFSNFGGLNCLSPQDIGKLLNQLPDILKPNGKFVAIIMPKYCLFEISSFLLRFKFGKAFRRATNDPVMVKVNDEFQSTWYYNPAFFKRRAHFRNFSFDCRPIGFWIPPSNFESFFRNRKKALRFLEQLEHMTGRIKMLSSFSDHYLMQIRLK